MIYLNFVDELVVDIFSILFLYREDFLDVLFISIFFYFLYSKSNKMENFIEIENLKFNPFEILFFIKKIFFLFIL